MNEQKKRATNGTSPQDPRRYARPANRRAAEKSIAITALQRAARRCARHLGRGCTAGLLELVKAELGGAP